VFGLIVNRVKFIPIITHYNVTAACVWVTQTKNGGSATKGRNSKNRNSKRRNIKRPNNQNPENQKAENRKVEKCVGYKTVQLFFIKTFIWFCCL